MAIVHMKKLRLMVVRGQKDALLRDLMLLGLDLTGAYLSSSLSAAFRRVSSLRVSVTLPLS